MYILHNNRVCTEKKMDSLSNQMGCKNRMNHTNGHRSLADFKADTDEHGWPSFRKEWFIVVGGYRVGPAVAFLVWTKGTWSWGGVVGNWKKLGFGDWSFTWDWSFSLESLFNKIISKLGTHPIQRNCGPYLFKLAIRWAFIHGPHGIHGTPEVPSFSQHPL